MENLFMLNQLEKDVKAFWKESLLRINHDTKNENMELILKNNDVTKSYLKDFLRKLENRYYPFVAVINHYELNDEEYLFDIYYKK